MDESFNPYDQWLGLGSISQRPDHYALLGLERFEGEQAKIKQAADRATARVRSFRPGAKARDWARLLDELDAARKCLTDADQKATYDQQLRDGAGDSPTPPAEEKAPAETAAPQAGVFAGNPSMFPPGMAPLPDQPRYGPAGPAPDDAPTTAAPSMAAPGDPALYAPGHTQAREHTIAGSNGEDSSPTMMPVGLPRRVPMGRDNSAAALDPMAPVDVGSTPSPATNPMDPMAPVGAMAAPVGDVDPMAPVAMPVTSGDGSVPMASPAGSMAMPTATPIAIDGSSSPLGDAAGDPTIQAKEKPANGISRNVIYAAAGALIVLAAGVVVMLFFLPGDSENDPVVANAGNNDPANGGSDQSPASNVNDNTDEEPIVDVPRGSGSGNEPPSITPAPEPEPPDITPTPMPDPDPMPDPGLDPVDVTPTPDPDPPTPTPDPDPSPAPLTPEEKQQLGTAFAGARRAMGARDFATVKRHLLTAERLARSQEHRAMLARLKELDHYLGEFWRAVDEAYANLQPSSSLMIGSAEVAIVEVRQDSLILRLPGRNKTFPRDEMPAALVLAIADQWFNSAPANKVVKGAFLLVDPDGRPDETRRLWHEAQDAGVDVRDLMPVLDDDYNL